jgi:hypothetical protein
VCTEGGGTAVVMWTSRMRPGVGGGGDSLGAQWQAVRRGCERWLPLFSWTRRALGSVLRRGKARRWCATYLAFMFESGSRANGDDPHGGAWTRAWRKEAIVREKVSIGPVPEKIAWQKVGWNRCQDR